MLPAATLDAYLTGDASGGFTLREMIASDTATRAGIANTPDAAMIETLRKTARMVLMPARLHYARGFAPLSAYRSLALEKVICAATIATLRTKAAVLGRDPGAAENAYLAGKAHPKGLACDIRVPGIDALTLGRWYAEESRVEFDQIIYEFYRHGDPAHGWVHVARPADGAHARGEVLWTPDGANYYPGAPHE